MTRWLLVWLCVTLPATAASAQQKIDLRGFFLGQPIEDVLAAPPEECSRTIVPALPEGAADVFTPPTEAFACSSGAAYVFYYLPITRHVWNIEYNFQCSCTVSDVVEQASIRYGARFQPLSTSEAPTYWQLLEHLSASTSDLTTIEIKHFADARAMGLPFDGDFFAISIVDIALGLKLGWEMAAARATSPRP